MLVTQAQFAAYAGAYNKALAANDYATAMEVMETAMDHARALRDAVGRALLAKAGC